jgi:hypothetical protein
MRRHEFNAMACCRGDSGMAPRCRGTQASDQASHGKHQPRQHQHDHQLLFQPARHAMPKRIDPDRREAKPGQAEQNVRAKAPGRIHAQPARLQQHRH